MTQLRTINSLSKHDPFAATFILAASHTRLASEPLPQHCRLYFRKSEWLIRISELGLTNFHNPNDVTDKFASWDLHYPLWPHGPPQPQSLCSNSSSLFHDVYKSIFPTIHPLKSNMPPVRTQGPLRRSLRRAAITNSSPSAMEIGSSPMPASSAVSVETWSKHFSIADSQSDTDSTLRNSTSCQSSGSCTDDTVSDATDSLALVSGLPQQFHKAYQGLAPIVGYSDAQFMELDVPRLELTLNEILALLRGVIFAGHSCQWAEFDKFLGVYQRILDVIEAKNAAAPPRGAQYVTDIDFRNIPGLEFAAGSNWVAMSGEDWQKTYKDTADTDFLRSMYKNAMVPSVFAWDEMVVAGASKDESGKESGGQSEQSTSLDYTLYPTH